VQYLKSTQVNRTFQRGKVQTVSTVKKRLWKLCRLIIISRDNYTCQWCHRVLLPAQCQVSHVIPRAQGNALYFDPLNLKILCFSCHRRKWHANPFEAAQWFAQTFPDRAAYLDQHKHDRVHWTLADFLEKEEALKRLMPHIATH
jgi:5-methylcytosine-specific restriction endonuclease McrA